MRGGWRNRSGSVAHPDVTGHGAAPSAWPGRPDRTDNQHRPERTSTDLRGTDGRVPDGFPRAAGPRGPGAGSPVGGFGGDPSADGTAHRTVVARTGKAPVLLVHGNGGAGDVRPWDMPDINRMLLAAGYPPELI